MRRSFRILIVVTLALTISCSEEFKPTPYTYTKIFTGENNKTWKINLLEVTQDGKVQDRWMDDCLTDDRFTFYANGDHSYVCTTGSKKCFADPDTEADTYTDTWTFNNATSALLIIVPRLSDQSLPYLVRQADKDDMILEIFLDQENTSSVRIHFDAINEE